MADLALAEFEASLQAMAAEVPAEFFPDFRRLARGLQSDIHVWRLFLLKFEHREAQEQVSSALRKLFGEITVLHAMAYDDWIDLEAALRDAAKLGKPIELPDLDQWLEDYPDPEQADRRLGAWNIQRESCALHVPVPLLCWLRPPRMAAFARRALDLWSWRHGVYDFSERDRVAEGALPQLATLMPDIRGFDNRDEQTKRARIAEIKQYLASEGDATGERLQVSLLSELADLYHRLSEWDEALRIYRDVALPMYRELGNKASEGATLNNISQIYKAQGDFETALDYVKQALTISQQTGNKAGEATTLSNISQFYHAQGDYETALDYLKQSLTISQQIGDKACEGATLNNISQIYKAQGDYETALGYLKQSLSICQQIDAKAIESATLNNISQIFKAQGDYETALGHLKLSLTICQQIGDKAGLCFALFNIGYVYLQNEQMQEAINAWVTVYTIAKQINLAKGLQALSKLAPRLGMPEGLEGWEQLAQHIQNGGEIEVSTLNNQAT